MTMRHLQETMARLWGWGKDIVWKERAIENDKKILAVGVGGVGS